MEKETNTVTLTTQELLKLINHDKAFKSSNWMEWIADEKSKRRHNTWVLGLSVILIVVMFTGFIYGAILNLISKETLTALLGSVSGAGITIFVKYIEKPAKE